jgi:hypothetical protein
MKRRVSLMSSRKPPTVRGHGTVTLPDELLDDIARVSLKWHYYACKEQLNEPLVSHGLDAALYLVARVEQFKAILKYYGVEVS